MKSIASFAKRSLAVAALSCACGALGGAMLESSAEAAWSSARSAVQSAGSDAAWSWRVAMERAARALAGAASDSDRASWSSLTTTFESAYGAHGALSLEVGKGGEPGTAVAMAGAAHATVDIPLARIGELAPSQSSWVVQIAAWAALAGLASMGAFRKGKTALAGPLACCAIAAAIATAHGAIVSEEDARAEVSRALASRDLAQARAQVAMTDEWAGFVAALPGWRMPAPSPVFALARAASELGEMGGLALVDAQGGIQMSSGSEPGWIKSRPLPASAQAARESGAIARSAAVCGFIAIPCASTSIPTKNGGAMVFFWPPEIKQWSPALQAPQVDYGKAVWACLGLGFLAFAGALARAYATGGAHRKEGDVASINRPSAVSN